MRNSLARTIYAEKIATEIAEHYDSEKKGFLGDVKKERKNIIFAISEKWGKGKTFLMKLLSNAAKT